MELFNGVLPIKGYAFLVFCIFAVATVGYLLGRITVKGVSLGTAGVFIVALVFGCLFYAPLDKQLTVDDNITVISAVANGYITQEDADKYTNEEITKDDLKKMQDG